MLIVQSFDERRITPWLARCLLSVEQWAAHCGYTYCFAGDELLDRLPGWYLDKVAPKMPVATDLARLLWMQELLQEQTEVAWVDADVLIFAPAQLDVKIGARGCVFGREYWLQQQDRKPRVYSNLHNAYCAFRRGNQTLGFLVETIMHLVDRVDPNHISPQFVGPKLLNSLHSSADLPWDDRWGALSPLFATELLQRGPKGVSRVLQRQQQPLAALNLCLSLEGDTAVQWDTVIDCLQKYPDGLGGAGQK